MPEYFIPLFVIIPLGSAFISSLLGKKLRRIPSLLTVLTTISLLILSIFSIIYFAGKTAVYETGGWKLPFGIIMVLDGLTAFMLVTVGFISATVAIYALNYMQMYTGGWQFHTLFMLMIAGMNGVIVTGDMFNLFVFLEIASIASYALVAFGTENEELEASFKYVIMGSLASLFVLLGIALLYSYTSTLNMAHISTVLTEKGGGYVARFSVALFALGLGLKAAIVPFHAWLPDAHPSAPAPISAMLSGLLIKVLGVYAMIRVLFNVIGMDPVISNVLLVLGTLSMIIGVFLAVGQWDLKRLLAYHSISQVGYMILAFGLNTPLGYAGGLFHLLNHSVFKSLLFLNSGALVYSAGTRNLQEMGGFREKMPVTSNTCLVASMSISGIPPFNGFWSKLIIIWACIDAGRPVYAFWAVLASILTLSSFAKVQKYVFFGILKEKWSKLKEVPFAMQFAMIALAAVCILGGLLWIIPELKEHFLDHASRVLEKGKDYAGIVMRGGK